HRAPGFGRRAAVAGARPLPAGGTPRRAMGESTPVEWPVNTGSLYGPWAWSQASAPYSGSAPNAVCYALVDTRESVEGDVHGVGDASPQGRPLVGARAAGAARALPVARGRRGDGDAGRDVLARRPGHRRRRGAVRAQRLRGGGSRDRLLRHDGRAPVPPPLADADECRQGQPAAVLGLLRAPRRRLHAGDLRLGEGG